MPVKITINFSDPVDADAFVRHYVNVHVPLVQALPGLRAYEYGRALTNFDGSEPDVFWSISMPALHAYTSERGATRSRPDGVRRGASAMGSS